MNSFKKISVISALGIIWRIVKQTSKEPSLLADTLLACHIVIVDVFILLQSLQKIDKIIYEIFLIVFMYIYDSSTALTVGHSYFITPGKTSHVCNK